MKKILFAIATIAPVVGFSQNTFPSSGNVGIGTTSPGVWFGATPVMEMSSNRPVFKLTSQSAYDLSTIVFTNSNVNASTHNGEFHVNYQYNHSDNTKSILGFHGYPSGYVLGIRADGNVGIGTNSPGARLDIDVNGLAGGIPALTIRNTESGKNYSGVLEFRSPTTTAPFYFYTWDNELQFSQRNSDGSWKSHFMIFHNQNGNVTFPNSTGNVGIGTNTPDSKLAVNGTVHAKEVKVDLTGWPDYVFSKEYPLQPLNEVKQFINQNGHLPEIPSAEEVETAGLHLGQMNALLLKKIEELTLHIIRQQEEIEQLKEALKK